MKRLLLNIFVIFGLISSLNAQSVEEQILDAANSFKKIAYSQNKIPKRVLQEAKALVIVPNMYKAGFFLGVKYGEGVATIKRGDGTWSNPFFIEIGGGSFGFQFGYENISMVLVFRTNNSVNGLLSKKFTLGAGASISAGPIGANYERNAEVNMSAEIFSYVIKNGLFAGVSLEGAVIMNKDEKNRVLYGGRTSVNEIVYGNKTVGSYSVQEFLKTIKTLTD